jgi:hypothetical protein
LGTIWGIIIIKADKFLKETIEWMMKWKFIDEEMLLKKFEDFAYGKKKKVLEEKFGFLKENKEGYVKILTDGEIRDQLKQDMIEVEKHSRDLLLREVLELKNETTDDYLKYMKKHHFQVTRNKNAVLKEYEDENFDLVEEYVRRNREKIDDHFYLPEDDIVKLEPVKRFESITIGNMKELSRYNIDKAIIQVMRNKGIEIKIEKSKSLIQIIKKDDEKCISIDVKEEFIKQKLDPVIEKITEMIQSINQNVEELNVLEEIKKPEVDIIVHEGKVKDISY